MRKLITILLIFVTNLLIAQSANITPAAIINVTNSVGADPYTITVVVNDPLSRFTLADFSVGDSVYLLDGSDLLIYTILIKSGNQLVIDDVNNTGISAPTGQGAIIKPTPNYKYPTYIVGLRDDLRSAMMNRQIQLIDRDIKNSDEIVDYVGISGVPPGISSLGLSNVTWRNTASELYYPNGSGGWFCGTCLETLLTNSSREGIASGNYKIAIDTAGVDTMYISNNGIFRRFVAGSSLAVNNTATTESVINLGVLEVNVKENSLDSLYFTRHGISLENISPRDATDGDVMRWNQGANTWDIDRYLRSYGNGYMDFTDPSGSILFWGVDATNNNFYSQFYNSTSNSSFFTDGTWNATIRKTQLGINQVNTLFSAELSGDTTATVTARSGGTNSRTFRWRTANTSSAQPSYIENLYKPAGTIYSHKLFFPDQTVDRNWFMPDYSGEVVAASRTDNPLNGEVLSWNSTNSVYEPIPITSSKVAVVRDSSVFRGYTGDAEIIIMEDEDRGGIFRVCTTCTADQYMVFTDASAKKWERINYDEIKASWFKSSVTDTLNHTDLQRGLNYVAQVGDKFKSSLFVNRPARIKNTVNRPEGVSIVGDSPLRGPKSNGLDAPPVDIIYVDLNDSTKIGIASVENARGYEVSGGVKNITLVAISKCSIVLEMNEPYRSNLDGVFVTASNGFVGGPIPNRLFDYGISVKGSVYTHANNVHIGGARKAGILGKAGRPFLDFGGGTFLWENSSVYRSTVGVEMELKDSTIVGPPIQYSQQYQSFDFNNFVLENIDSFGIRSAVGFTWTNSYTENVPLTTNGSFIFLTGEAGRVILNNVSPNAADTCRYGNCYVFNKAARFTKITNAFVNNFHGLLDTILVNDNFIGEDISHLGMVDTTSNFDKSNVRISGFYPYTGASALIGSKNNLNQTYKIKALADNTGVTGTNNQFLKSNGNRSMTWTNILPNMLGQQGAALNDVLTWNGSSYVPLAPLAAGRPSNEVAYGNGSSLTSKPEFYFNSTTNRLSINAGASPSAKIHSISAGEDAARFTNSLGTLGFSVNSSGNIVPIGNTASITAGFQGGFGLSFGTLLIRAVGLRIEYATYYQEGHMFKHDAPITATTGGFGTISIVESFNPTGGNSTYNGVAFNTSVNPDPSHTGQINMLYLGPTVIGANAANRASAWKMENIHGWGVNQTYSEIDNGGYTIRNSFMAKTGIGVSLPNLRFEVNSRKARTNAIVRYSNDTDSTQFFVSNVTPEALISGNPGDIVFSEQGKLYQKLTGTGNTGWGSFLNLSDANGATAGQALIFNGTVWGPSTISGGVTTVGTTVAPTPNGATITGSTINMGQAGTTNPGILQLAGDLTGTYTSPQIAANAVGTSEIAANSINSGHIIDGNVATNDIADGAVNSVKITDASIVNGDIALETITTNRIQNGTVQFIDWSANGADTTGQFPYWNQSSSSWELSNPITLDSAYNNYKNTASKINVDAGQGQTGGLEFEHTGSTDFIVDLQGTGDFRVQDAGNNVFRVDDTGFSSFGNVASSSNQRLITNMSGVGTVTVPLRISNNTEPIDGDGLRLPFTLGTNDVLNIEYSDLVGSPAKAKIDVITGGSLENYIAVTPSIKETRFQNALAVEIDSFNTGTSHQLSGRTSTTYLFGATLTSVTLPEIVTGVPGTNQVNAGYFFELILKCDNIMAINSSGSDIMAIDGSPATDVTFNNAAGTWLYKKFLAIGDNN